MPISKSEKMIQNEILDYLIDNGIGLFWQNDSFGLKGRKRKTKYRPNGVPDILGVVRGLFVGIEVKTDNGKVSTEQLVFGEWINQNGGMFVVARSIDDIKELAYVNGWDNT